MLVMLVGVARAQPATTEPVKDPAWAAYDIAFDHAAKGDHQRAHSLLASVIARWPDHPAAARAQVLVGELTREEQTVIARRARSKYSNVARGELVFWSTIGGVFVG